MRLLILGINYAPEIISTAVYTTDLAEDMASRGHDVSVVAALPYFPAWKIMDGWSQGWRFERRDGVDVVHCPLYVPSKPSGARRILHHVSFAVASLPIALWWGLRRRPDIVLVVAPSLIAAPVGWLAARLVRARCWLHVQDFEVEAAFSTGLLNENGWIGRAARAFEGWVLRRFDRVSSISAPMLAKLKEKGVPGARVFELRNWANLDAVTPADGPSPMRAELGINTRYVALYSGNLANKQGLSILPKVARLLEQRGDVTIVICGDGPMRDDLVAMSAGIGNIRFIPLQPLDRLSDLLGMADVHLLPQVAGVADLMLPSKLTNMLASGRPVVATTLPDTALGREVDHGGLNTPPGDAEAMAAAVEALLDQPSERIRLGAAARARALENWSRTAVLDRLEEEMCTMTSAAGTKPRAVGG